MPPFPTARNRRLSRLAPRLLTAGLVLVVLLGGCGGNGKPVAGPAGGGTPTGSTSPSQKPGTKPGSPGPTATATPKPGATATAKPTATPIKSTATLDKACVHRGTDSDQQGLTVHTSPGGPAGFNTQYADGSSSVDKGSNYHSGFGGGFADSTGFWRLSWIVPKDAPPGTATVKVVTADGYLELPFTVVKEQGSCP